MSESKTNSGDSKPLVNPKESERQSTEEQEADDIDTEMNFSSYSSSVPRKNEKRKPEKAKSSSGKSSIVSWFFGKR
ncbi:unnamed protein product [Chironomus riparius]|uniref:Uncharacterized protein n=1 Tax=Chironomus riparius TaxID=315576 RepID=A0A9N9RR70_9DIPT|nr:unnamed protein product [Chironomus riparius]